MLLRLSREGVVRTTQPLRFTGSSIASLTGLAVDRVGNVVLYGGVGEGPYAPGLASVDRGGNVVWSVSGRYGMPPGGVRAVRIQSNGAVDAVVIDQGKTVWDRRSPSGALLGRSPSAIGHYCWGFLGERRPVQLFLSRGGEPGIAPPLDRWVLVRHGTDGRPLPPYRVLDMPPTQWMRCALAVNDAGWIAVSTDGSRIAILNSALTPRGEIDAAAQGATSIVELTVDRAGGVTALADTSGSTGRRWLLLRYAAPAAR